MSYKWLELWSNKNKWKSFHILIEFNLFWEMKENKDHRGHSSEGGKSFCFRVQFAPKWKAEWIVGGSAVVGWCLINTIFFEQASSPCGCTQHSHSSTMFCGEWARREEGCSSESMPMNSSPKLGAMFLALEELNFINGKHAKNIYPEQYYGHCVCKFSGLGRIQ